MLSVSGQSDWVDRLHLWLDRDPNLALWLTAIATCGLLIGLALAWFSLRDAKRTRHGLLITEIMRDWTRPNVVRAIRLHNTYGEAKIPALVEKMFAPGKTATPHEVADWGQLALVANLIETLGVLVSEDAITIDVVYKMWGGAILTAWPKWEKAIDLLRGYDKEPDTFIYFEQLASQVRRIRDDRRSEHRDTVGFE